MRLNSIFGQSTYKGISLLLAFLINADSALAQTGANAYFNPPTALSGKLVIIPSGTTLEGRIESTIGSSVSKQGERFVITLTSPALANGSDVLIPAGAEILGEVVQAVPSGKVTHLKKEKPFGKLRIQIVALKMPDGTTYPMVASLTGDEDGRGQNPNLGGGIAYAGSSNNFEAVAPTRVYRTNGRRGPTTPHVVTKQELLKDPILGTAGANGGEGYGIRSLIRKKRNLYIYQGSPLTVRLNAPFKMAIGVARSAGSALDTPAPPPANGYGGGHRRFNPSAEPEPPAASTVEPGPGAGLPFLQRNPAPANNSNATTNPSPLPPARTPAPANNSQDSNF